MWQLAKYACPIIVLLGLVVFPGNQSRFVLPISLEVISISTVYFLWSPLRTRSNAAAMLLFWLAPLAIFWLLSERREGRDIEPISIGIEIGLAGLGTAILMSKNSLNKSDVKLIELIFMTWAVGFFSGRSGGADRMVSTFDFLHLTVAQLDTLIMVIRKTIHLTFYGGLTWLFATSPWPEQLPRRALVGFSVALPLAIAVSDEFRQSMMPNRQGSLSDVVVDMSATFAVLIVLHFLERKKQRNTTIG